MSTADEAYSIRKEKIKNWLKNRDNLIFLGIIILAVIVRFYYFFITQNQPLWWDESDYMAYAKNLAGFNTHWIVTDQHNSLFPFIVAVFFKIGFSEVAIRFLLEVIPSILVILLSFLICKELFSNKKVAVISAILMTSFWEITFNSMRFHLEGLGLLFGYLAIYLFIKGYEKKEKIFGKINPCWSMVIVAVLVVLTYALRRGFFLFGAFIIIYLLFTKNLKEIIKDKYNWLAAVLGVILLIIVEKFIFVAPITKVAGVYYKGGTPFTLVPFSIFKAYFENIFNPNLSILLYIFWLGLAVSIIYLLFYVGHIKKAGNANLFRGDLWAAVMVIITLSYFLFYQRSDNLGDVRWFYPLLLGAFIYISKGTLWISDFIKKYSKIASILFIVLIIGYGGYYELKHADFIINDKVNSFNGIKQVALYLKEIAPEDAITISIPVPQPAYYAEREFWNPRDWLKESPDAPTPSPDAIKLDQFLDAVRKNERVKYMIVTLSEPNHPPWMRTDYYAQNPQTGQTVYAKFEIPIMNSSVDFTTGKQDIKTTMSYPGLTFNLLTIKDDAFLYEIVHN